MSKDSSAKYYQNNKERLQKLVKDTKVFLKKKKKKSKTYRYERYRYLTEDEK